MKNFFLGLLIGLLFISIPVKAVEATLSLITVRDLYAASVMGGEIGRITAPISEKEVRNRITESFFIADLMLKERGK